MRTIQKDATAHLSSGHVKWLSKNILLKTSSLIFVALFLFASVFSGSSTTFPAGSMYASTLPTSLAWSKDVAYEGYADGVPIGGLGAGTITWKFDGNFDTSRLDIGKNYDEDKQNMPKNFIRADNDAGFYMYQKPSGQAAKFMRLDAASIGANQATYYALFPKAWVDYYGSNFTCKMKVTEFSPIIPNDYQRTSYPIGIFKWEITNPGTTSCDVGIMLTFKNDNIKFGGTNATAIVTSGNKGVTMRRNGSSFATEENQGEFSVAAKEADGVTVTYLADISVAKIEDDFADDGRLGNTVGNYRNGAVAFKATLPAGASITVPIVLTWDIPICQADKVDPVWPERTNVGHKWYREYTRYYGRSGLNSATMAADALANYPVWENSIDIWQNGIVNNPKYPSWLKTGLFNELYYYFVTGTYWEAGAASGQLDNPSEDMFSSLECFDYLCYGTSDVRFYSSWALSQLWPNIDKQEIKQFSDAVVSSRPDRPTPIGTIPHDFGGPASPFREWNYYQFRDTTKWTDLNTKFVLMVYRSYLNGNDTAFLDYCWPSVKACIQKTRDQDTDGDSMPNHTTGADCTYDNMSMKGNCSYTAGLYIAALQAAKQMALLKGETATAATYQTWLSALSASFDAKMWNGSFFKSNDAGDGQDRIHADQLCGQWWSKALGLGGITTDAKAQTVLNKIFNKNFKLFGYGKAGAVNMITDSGVVDMSTEQSKETWIGVNYGLACAMIQQGMYDKAYEMAGTCYKTVWEDNDLYFRSPEAWTQNGSQIRGSYYMRAPAIWAVKREIDAKGTAAPDVAPDPAPLAKGKNLALYKNVVVSSNEDTTKFPAFNLVDGGRGTRWASGWNDAEWFYVDLGYNCTVNRVIIDWEEKACAAAYKIQVSTNATNWTDVYSVTEHGLFGRNDIRFANQTARYVRMLGIDRASVFGYSIWEIEVYGTDGTAPSPVVGPIPTPRTVESWYSSNEGVRYKLSQQPDLSVGAVTTNEYIPAIVVDPAKQYQSVLGLGASMDEATVYNLCRMPADKRSEVLNKLYNPTTGAGWNYMRIAFGSCDFSGRSWYSYDDGTADPNLVRFSIQKDIDYNIISTIKEALVINPNIKILASAWSPPGWMKDSNSLCGGQIKSEYLGLLAKYYRKAIEAYKAQGITVYGMTLQNEPSAVTTEYPTCKFSKEQQRDFSKLMAAELKNGGLDTKVWAFDWVFADAADVDTITADSDAYQGIDGVGYHDYWGEISVMSDQHNKYPYLDVAVTERTRWETWGVDRELQYFRNWARGHIAWVVALDQDEKPNNGPHNPDPTFVVADKDNPYNYSVIPEYYMFGQVSKFVQSGAVRIDSTYGSPAVVTNVAFLNPDGKIVVVVVNQNNQSKQFKIVCQDHQFKTTIPGKTVATYRWTPNAITKPAAIWFQDFEAGTGFSGGSGAAAYSANNASPNAGLNKSVFAYVNNSQDPATDRNCVKATSKTGSAVNAADYDYMIFYTLDTVGSNTVKVTLVDTANATWSTFLSNKAVKNYWTKMCLPMSMVTGINKAAIKEVRLGEWNAGAYLFDDIYFSKNYDDAPPALPTGVAYTATNQIEAENSSLFSGISVSDSANDAGRHIELVDQGDWLDYYITVAAAGTYKISYRVASMSANGSMELYNGLTLLSTTGAANTGGWDTWTTVTSSESFTLGAGNLTVRVRAKSGNFNLDWIKFIKQ